MIDPAADTMPVTNTNSEETSGGQCATRPAPPDPSNQTDAESPAAVPFDFPKSLLGLLNLATPSPPAKPRRLGPLETPADVKREFARLYADHHHKRIPDKRFTQRVYALNSLLATMRLAQQAQVIAGSLTGGTGQASASG